MVNNLIFIYSRHTVGQKIPYSEMCRDRFSLTHVALVGTRSESRYPSFAGADPPAISAALAGGCIDNKGL